MFYFLKVLSSILLPPGVIIIVLFGLSIYLIKREKTAARLLGLITVVFYLICINLSGDLMIRSLEDRYNPPQNVEGDVIIMLGGGAITDTPDIDGLGSLSGSSANRLLTSARLSNKIEVPIIISGGQVFKESANEAQIARRILLGLGVPEGRIIIEDVSRNTKENALYTEKILDANGFKKPILVTSAFHMERSVRNFTKQNVNVQPFPTDYMSSGNMLLHYSRFIPSSGGLSSFCIAAREYLGIMALSLN